MKTILICAVLLCAFRARAQSDEAFAITNQGIDIDYLVESEMLRTRAMAAQQQALSMPMPAAAPTPDQSAEISQLKSEVTELKRQRANAVALLQKQWEEIQALKKH